MEQKRNALLSVYDKEGITDFARGLVNLNWNIISSGGTAKAIADAGIPVQDVAELVGGKAILGHRVVTLSREVYGGLMATDSDEDVTELEALGVPRIDLVCVDMYPLLEEIERLGATLESVIEKTDVGGPTMLRSGAKGRRIVLCKASQRQQVLEWLTAGEPDREDFLRELAAEAEFTVSEYVRASAEYLGAGRYLGVSGTKFSDLRYGENARQSASLYEDTNASRNPLALSQFERVEGGEMSYINVTDMDRLLHTCTRISSGFAQQHQPPKFIAVAAKHGNACGAAVGRNTQGVIKRMIEGDVDAIMGGSIMCTFAIDEEIATLLTQHQAPGGGKRVLDNIFAPSFSEEAIEILSRKQGRCHMYQNESLALSERNYVPGRQLRQVHGGFLVQDADTFVPDWSADCWALLSDLQLIDVTLGWAIGSTSNSNSIVLTKDGMLLGSGIAQTSRVRAAKVAVMNARESGHELKGATAYSDSFFPYPDGLDTLVLAGIKTIFTSSGSVRDDTVIEAAEEYGVQLIMLPDSEVRGFFGH